MDPMERESADCLSSTSVSDSWALIYLAEIRENKRCPLEVFDAASSSSRDAEGDGDSGSGDGGRGVRGSTDCGSRGLRGRCL